MIELLTDALAAYRIVRLVTTDTVFDTPRAKAKRWAALNGHPQVYELITCRWCVGVWVGFGVIAARKVAPRAWGPVASALACASVAALGERIEG